ncbi:MAG: DUF4159 domain-containing protein [Mariniphaga sp.]|nr:DUF4159 domain-containing protein [Mariniphaga sp.]
MKKTHILFFILIISSTVFAQSGAVKIALIKYNGGGDWYADPTALPNLIEFCNNSLNSNILRTPATVEIGSQELFNYPFAHLTGHGNIILSESDARNLRLYLQGGGFLHVDDNYGLDEYFRREMKKVFPEKDLIELPPNHPVFNQRFKFANGLPKIHEHDNKQPQAFGLFVEDRLVCLYTYEADLGDGWEDAEIHNDPEEVRTRALQMGANIISYAFGQ